MEVVEQDQFTQNGLAKHLASSEILNEKYLALVPDQIPHMEFWQRYLFKRALLEDALANAEIAERKAKAEQNSTKTTSPTKAQTVIQTEQPKLVMDAQALDKIVEVAKEVVVVPTSAAPAAPPAAVAVAEKNIIDDKWETEDFANVEISEEEQARLLQEYEAEIQERELKKSQIIPIEEKVQ